jgi:hypothetical protein
MLKVCFCAKQVDGLTASRQILTSKKRFHNTSHSNPVPFCSTSSKTETRVWSPGVGCEVMTVDKRIKLQGNCLILQKWSKTFKTKKLL